MKANSEGNPDANPDVIPEVDLGIDSDAIKSNEKCNETSYTNCNLLLARKCQDHVKCAVETFWSPVTELWVHLEHLCMKMGRKLFFVAKCDLFVTGKQVVAIADCRLKSLCCVAVFMRRCNTQPHRTWCLHNAPAGADRIRSSSSQVDRCRQNRHTSP